MLVLKIETIRFQYFVRFFDEFFLIKGIFKNYKYFTMINKYRIRFLYSLDKFSLLIYR